MKPAIFFVLIAIFFAGCASKGYVPHYIVTDSLEPKQETHKYEKDLTQEPSLPESSQ